MAESLSIAGGVETGPYVSTTTPGRRKTATQYSREMGHKAIDWSHCLTTPDTSSHQQRTTVY